MKSMMITTLALAGMLALAAPSAAVADNLSSSTVGAGGYDLVSYRTGEKPLRGNGNHLVEHDGTTFLFINDANKKKFESNPAKFLPAYGGFCAFGVSVGKKFVGDPDVWEIVDGQLYVNLDNKIKGLWIEDVAGNIKKANNNWPRIQGTAPSDL